MKAYKNFFRIFVILMGFALTLWAANPSVPQDGGKQYAEVVEGNNALMHNPMNTKLYGGPEVEAI